MTALPDPTSQPTRSSIIRKRVLKGSLITLGVGTVAFVGLVIFALIQLEGGWPWAFTSAPEETDREVVAANQAGDSERNKLVASVQAAGSVADLTRVTATPPELRCRTGQHNWKRNDDFDLQCTSKVSLMLGSGLPTETIGSETVESTAVSEAALRTQLLLLHEQLVAQGWKSSYQGNTMTSIKERLDNSTGRSRSTSVPFLSRGGTAGYFHGKGGKGSATITLDFAAQSNDYAAKKLEPVAPGTADEFSDYRAAQSYLADGAHYIATVQLTYVTFYG